MRRGPISSSTAATSPGTRRPIRTILTSPANCTPPCPWPAATFPAITISATIRPRSGRRRRSPPTEQDLQAFRVAFGEDRWRFEAAGWCFIGLNSLVMNTGLASEAEQFDWLASAARGADGKPVALFLHKPLFLNSPDDPELAASAIRYVPMPARQPSCGDARCGRPAAGRQRPRAPAPGFYSSPCQARLGAVRRLHHSRCEAGSDRRQGGRAGGIPFPARRFRGPSRQGAGPGRCRPGFATRPGARCLGRANGADFRENTKASA